MTTNPSNEKFYERLHCRFRSAIGRPINAHTAETFRAVTVDEVGKLYAKGGYIFDHIGNPVIDMNDLVIILGIGQSSSVTVQPKTAYLIQKYGSSL